MQVVDLMNPNAETVKRRKNAGVNCKRQLRKMSNEDVVTRRYC